MSFWGTLAGIGGLVAAPFTAGTSLSWVPAAFGAGAMADGMLSNKGGGGTMGGTGKVTEDYWGDNNPFGGDTSVTGNDNGSDPSLTALLMKYGLPAIAGALKGRTDQKNFESSLAQQKQLVQGGQALEQSRLDPFRGVMAQTTNAGRLEHAMQPPPAYGPAAGSRYASAVPSRSPITLSPAYLMALQKAQQGVLSGQATMPNMLDPAQWGKTGTQDLTTPMPPSPFAGAPGAGLGTMSPTNYLARRPLPAMGRSRLDDEWNSAA